jgi:predicted  nucleic acid-binding Zn-ribbon protein
MEVDFQFFMNVVIGLITFFGGWILKAVWAKTQDNAKDIDKLWEHHENDLKEARQKINDLALSLPEKYVSKSDFQDLVQVDHHRFDRIEEKIDHLSSNRG